RSPEHSSASLASAPSGTRCGSSCPRVFRPASSYWSMASLTASSRAKTCGRKWRASLIIASIEPWSGGSGEGPVFGVRAGESSGDHDPLASDHWESSVGIFAKIFGKGPRSKLPRIDVSKRFDLLGRTGQGSMSKVWRARDRRIGRVVCLKVLDKIKTAKF